MANRIGTVQCYFDNSGNTVNICALDLSKAFDKVNHQAMFIKLMKRNILVKLLSLIENLFCCCSSCIKWNNVWSGVFQINLGVRQGSVLSPFVFAIYLDDLSKLCSSFTGCYIILYADDILLISPSVTKLESLLHCCLRACMVRCDPQLQKIVLLMQFYRTLWTICLRHCISMSIKIGQVL